MQITTKYKIGDKMIIIKSDRPDVIVSKGIIDYIIINETGIKYCLLYDDNEYEENELIPFYDDTTLIYKIKKIFGE